MVIPIGPKLCRNFLDFSKYQRTLWLISRSADREADPELAAACRPRASTPREALRCPSAENEQADSAYRTEGESRHMRNSGARPPSPGREQVVVDLSEAGGDGCAAVLSNDSDFLVMDIPG